MSAISLETTKDKFVIEIDKNLIDKDFLLQWLDKLRIEFLAQKIDFGEEVEILGKQIKSEWWEKNKDRFLPTEP